MEITGKAHNPENAELAADFVNLYKRTTALQLPPTFKLNAPVRSNRTSEKLSNEGIIEDMITMIIASCCDWDKLLNRVAEDMKTSERPSHRMVSFGMDDCVPVTPFNRQRLKITKFQASVLIEPLEPVESSRNSPTNFALFPDDAIAVTGVSCRLPGANNLDELWELISQGVDCHQEVPVDRFDPHNIFRVAQSGTSKDKKFFGNFLDDVKGFDRAFFGMGMKETANVDPQQRLLLELAIEALEASGYLATHVREDGDRVGCFVGASFIEYLENSSAHPPTAYTAPGTIRAFLCGRLSYYFGWTAPAEVIDTACSASMVAINRACKSIQMGECNMALAGGVNLITGMNNYLDLGKANFLSPTGQCKPFDQSGDGYCRSDGAGFVVLKKLNQALADRDPIMGVIPGIATNQGGLSTSLTVPSSIALQALYREVISQSGLQPSQITYVEAHGTGTQAGDPIEVESIRSVLGDASRADAVSIGSVKGNIGHCETGAGVAGLLKVLAMIKHGGIPPLANHETLNPKIPALEPDRMEITKKLKPWNVPLRAALVNSYGAAGSNAALICCEPPSVSDRSPSVLQHSRESVSWPIIISGATRKSLVYNAQSLATYLSQKVPNINIEDVAFTLNQRRKRHRFCAEVVATDMTSLAQALSCVESPAFEYPSQPNPIVLVFSGQNTNTVALDRGIYERYPSFRALLDTCDFELTKLGYSTIREAIFQKEPITDAVLLQCSIFAVQYACARCWIDAGLKPQAIIGHSFGELTALAVSGALSLSDSLKLVTCRADLINTKWGSEKGGMLVVHAGVDTVQKLQARFKSAHNGAELEIACYNSPTTTVVAGATAHIDAAEQMLATDPEFSTLRTLRISTSHAFHSSLSNPILAELDAMASSLTWNEPQIPLEACTKEGLTTIRDWSASRHTRGSVYFTKAVDRVEKRLGPCIWFEAGLDSAIISMARKASATPDLHVFQPVSTKTGPASFVNSIISGLWRHGISLSHWNYLEAAAMQQPMQVWLPPYQFEREPYWAENIDRVLEAQRQNISNVAKQPVETQDLQGPLRLVSRLTSSDTHPARATFQINTKCDRFQKITAGHAVLHQPLCPASLYMECVVMAIEELDQDLEGRTLDFSDLEFHAGLGLQTARKVCLNLEELETNRSWKFTVQSTLSGSSRPLVHCGGTIRLSHDSVPLAFQRLVEAPIERLDRSQDAERLMASRAYGLFSVVMHYAEFLKPISSIIVQGNESLATVKLPANQPGLNESTAWPRCDAVFLDGIISSSGLLLNSSDVISNSEVMIAMGIERAFVTASCRAELAPFWQAYASFTMVEDSHALCDIFVCTPERKLVAMMTGVRFNKMETSKLARSLSSVNASPTTHQASIPVSKPKALVPAPQIPQTNGFQSVPISHSPTSLHHINNTTPLKSEPAKFTEVPPNAIPFLRSLISEYTGLSDEDIPEDKPLVDLGLDSLSSIEFASEVQSKLGVGINSDEASEMTLRSLGQRLRITSDSTFEVGENIVQAEVSVANVTALASGNMGISSVLTTLISSYTGLIAEDIPHDVPLVDLGLDSLSCIEFASEMGTSFGIEIDSAIVGDMTLQSLVRQIPGLDTPLTVSTPSSTGLALSTPNDISTCASTPFTTGSSTPNWQNLVTTTSTKEYFPNQTVVTNDEYTIETVEFKRVSSVPIHADIYVPRMIRTSPMPIGMH